MLIRYGFSKRRFDLFGHVKVVEDGQFACVLFHDARTFRGYQRHVVFYFTENIRIVDIDVFIRRIEQIPQHGYRAAGFFKYQFGKLACFLRFNKGILTSFD